LDGINGFGSRSSLGLLLRIGWAWVSGVRIDISAFTGFSVNHFPLFVVGGVRWVCMKWREEKREA